MKLASWFSGLSIAGGLWVMLSPAIDGFAGTSAHHPWTAPSEIATILGALLVLLGIAGLAGFYAAMVAHPPKVAQNPPRPLPGTPRREERRPSAPTPTRAAAPQGAQAQTAPQDTDALLNELMHRLLNETQK